MSLRGNTIGIVEDDPIIGESLALSLSLEGCHVRWWKSGAEALSELPYSSVNAVICDIRLPDMDGSVVFKQTRHQRRSTPFLFMTAYGSIEQAVELVKQGAIDYLAKPFDIQEFLDKLDDLLAEDSSYSTEPVLGQSTEIVHIEAFLRRIVHTDLPVLFYGETGGGKEVCARFLHSLRTEDSAPFMALNCAAIPPELLERELLGSENGGDGGVIHRGYAERAMGGTLFLDEVDELPMALQAKLLRFIEDNAFYRIGGQDLVPMQCRIMCATLADLQEKVDAGRFRKDLFFRINSASVLVPPLRERSDDILWLSDLFLQQQMRDGRRRQLTPAAQQSLLDHLWPGNVRELRNRVIRAAAVAADLWIGPEDLFPDNPSPAAGQLGIQSLARTRQLAEQKQIEFALQSKNGRINEAARALGISRTTMWEKMVKYGIDGADV